MVISSEKPRWIVHFLHGHVMVKRNKLSIVIRRSLFVMYGLAAAAEARVPGLLYVKRQ